MFILFSHLRGKEKVYQTNSLEFDINSTKELDVQKMISFADEVNALLDKSILLMSTEGGDFSSALRRNPSMRGIPGWMKTRSFMKMATTLPYALRNTAIMLYQGEKSKSKTKAVKNRV